MADGMGHLAGSKAGVARVGEAAALCRSCHPLATPVPHFTTAQRDKNMWLAQGF